MLYKLFNSKKGFTAVEILVVLIIMSILVAIAVPSFSSVIEKQRKDDCRNQRLVIETAVKQAMYGMIDNGKRQPVITFVCSAEAGGTRPCHYDVTADGEKYFKLTGDSNCFTLGELRGGYRPETIEDYKEGCDAYGCYLKKKAYKDVPFYKYLDNAELPVCPFADDENSQGYYYYVLADGSVHCSNEACQEAE